MACHSREVSNQLQLGPAQLDTGAASACSRGMAAPTKLPRGRKHATSTTSIGGSKSEVWTDVRAMGKYIFPREGSGIFCCHNTPQSVFLDVKFRPHPLQPCRAHTVPHKGRQVKPSTHSLGLRLPDKETSPTLCSAEQRRQHAAALALIWARVQLGGTRPH